MNAVKNDVEKLVEKELATANKKFPQFHSKHEGYAVILEEVEEAAREIDWIKADTEDLWDCVKHNSDATVVDNIVIRMLESAINAACEAIQVAAMCDKFLEIGKEVKY